MREERMARVSPGVLAGAAEGRWALDLRVSMQDLAKYAKTPGATTKTPGDTLAGLGPQPLASCKALASKLFC